MAAPEHVRLDKWLWAVRLYKSRSLATSACTGGHVKISGKNVKPSREVRIGDVISAKTGFIQRTVKVVQLLERRVSAKVASEHLEDLTPPDEYARAKAERPKPLIQYPKGWGRPTKKQRRQLDQLRDES